MAKDLVEWLERQGLRGLLTEEEQVRPDPMVVLYAVHRRHPHSDLVSELEERLTQQELKAVPSAWPTAYADPLIRTWSAVGARLAIATNNSARTATGYLASRDLTNCFAPNIYGRGQDLHHLKPDPHCLNRALNALGAAPAAALMIDAPRTTRPPPGRRPLPRLRPHRLQGEAPARSGRRGRGEFHWSRYCGCFGGRPESSASLEAPGREAPGLTASGLDLKGEQEEEGRRPPGQAWVSRSDPHQKEGQQNETHHPSSIRTSCVTPSSSPTPTS